MKKTLAYYDMELITAVKSFTLQIPDVIDVRVA